MSDIIVGRQPVLEALRSGRPVNRVLLLQDSGRHSVVAEILHLAQVKKIPVDFVSRLALEQASGAAVHQGVLAFAASKSYVALDDLAAISREKGESPLYCLLDGIEDPQNLGAILRVSGATGTHGVVIRSRRAVGLTAAVAKASAGAIEYVPVARVSNIAYSIADLQRQNVWVVGIDGRGERLYTDIDYTVPTAIVIGGEGRGVSDLVRRKCDSLARIPMRGDISSLNASVAAALVLYEAYRQRGW
ncbi:MAG: 23S rRNA (guanosine(2251)-2'-O)-methyltransferase RlmB [Dehalococcoidia bacterium]|nr:MAG: 23S rRNA (guanosine(2251)-2'-O)-methyltransferase RlmB [Dehalococcoidia bacterium]